MEQGTKVIFTFNDRDTCETITCSGVFLGKDPEILDFTLEDKIVGYFDNKGMFKDDDFKLHCIEIEGCVQNIEKDPGFFATVWHKGDRPLLEIHREEIEAFANWIENYKLREKHAAVIAENISEISAL